MATFRLTKDIFRAFVNIGKEYGGISFSTEVELIEPQDEEFTYRFRTDKEYIRISTETSDPVNQFSVDFVLSDANPTERLFSTIFIKKSPLGPGSHLEVFYVDKLSKTGTILETVQLSYFIDIINVVDSDDRDIVINFGKVNIDQSYIENFEIRNEDTTADYYEIDLKEHPFVSVRAKGEEEWVKFWSGEITNTTQLFELQLFIDEDDINKDDNQTPLIIQYEITNDDVDRVANTTEMILVYRLDNAILTDPNLIFTDTELGFTDVTPMRVTNTTENEFDSFVTITGRNQNVFRVDERFIHLNALENSYFTMKFDAFLVGEFEGIANIWLGRLKAEDPPVIEYNEYRIGSTVITENGTEYVLLGQVKLSGIGLELTNEITIKYTELLQKVFDLQNEILSELHKFEKIYDTVFVESFKQRLSDIAFEVSLLGRNVYENLRNDIIELYNKLKIDLKQIQIENSRPFQLLKLPESSYNVSRKDLKASIIHIESGELVSNKFAIFDVPESHNSMKFEFKQSLSAGDYIVNIEDVTTPLITNLKLRSSEKIDNNSKIILTGSFSTIPEDTTQLRILQIRDGIKLNEFYVLDLQGGAQNKFLITSVWPILDIEQVESSDTFEIKRPKIDDFNFQLTISDYNTNDIGYVFYENAEKDNNDNTYTIYNPDKNVHRIFKYTKDENVESREVIPNILKDIPNKLLLTSMPSFPNFILFEQELKIQWNTLGRHKHEQYTVIIEDPNILDIIDGFVTKLDDNNYVIDEGKNVTFKGIFPGSTKIRVTGSVTKLTKLYNIDIILQRRSDRQTVSIT